MRWNQGIIKGQFKHQQVHFVAEGELHWYTKNSISRGWIRLLWHFGTFPLHVLVSDNNKQQDIRRWEWRQGMEDLKGRTTIYYNSLKKILIQLIKKYFSKTFRDLQRNLCYATTALPSSWWDSLWLNQPLDFLYSH